MSAIHGNLGPIFERIAQISLQAAVLVVVVLVAQWVLRPWLAPRWRHALWFVVIARLVLPVAPESPHSLYNWLPAMPEARVEVADAPTPPTPAAITASPPVVRIPVERPSTAPAPMPVETRSHPISPSPSVAAPAVPVPWLAWGWLLGVVAMAGALGLANSRLSRMVRLGRVVDDARVLAVLADCQSRAGVSRRVTVMALDEGCNPALVGHLRPRIVLPGSLLTTADEEQLRHIFLHELAHWKRRDIPLNWLTALLLVVHWFNPALWFAWHRMRLDRELACDALALSWANPGEAGAYGRTILTLLDRGASMRALPGAIGIFESHAGLKRRIAMIARFTPNANRWSVLAVAVLALLAYTGLTDAQQQGRETESASTELVDAALRAADREQLEYLARVFRSYVHNQRLEAFPPLDGGGCRLVPAREALLPRYLTNPSALVSPWVEMPEGAEAEAYFDQSTYWYMPYAVIEEATALMAIETIREACEERTELPTRVPETTTGERYAIALLRNGMERLFITNIHDPDAEAKARAKVPVLIGQPVTFSDGTAGGHVLYMDGSVRFHPYPGDFPMTERVIEALTAFDPPEGEERADSQAAAPAEPVAGKGDELPQWAVEAFERPVQTTNLNPTVDEAFESIAEQAGVQIKLDPRMGTLSRLETRLIGAINLLSVRPQPFRDAFGMILEFSNLDYVVKGDHIWVSTPELLSEDGLEGIRGLPARATVRVEREEFPDWAPAALRKRVTLTGYEESIAEILAVASEQSGVWIEPDPRVFDDTAWEQRLAMPLHGGKSVQALESLLNWTLRVHGLDYVIQEDHILVSTPDLLAADGLRGRLAWNNRSYEERAAERLGELPEWVEQAFEKSVEVSMEFHDVPEALDQLAEQYAVRIEVDRRFEPEDSSLVFQPNRRAIITASNYPLATLMAYILSRGSLDYAVKDDHFWVSRPEWLVEDGLIGLLGSDGDESRSQMRSGGGRSGPSSFSHRSIPVADPYESTWNGVPARLRVALMEPVHETKHSIHILDMLDFLSEFSGVDIVVDGRVRPQLDVARGARTPRAPFHSTHQMMGISVQGVLDGLVNRFDLDYAVKNDHIVISSPELLAQEGLQGLREMSTQRPPSEMLRPGRTGYPSWANTVLEMPVSISASNAPLAEVLGMLSERLGDLPIRLDPRLEVEEAEDGERRTTVVHAEYANAPLERILEAVLTPLRLDYAFTNEYIWVSSPELLSVDGLDGSLTSPGPRGRAS